MRREGDKVRFLELFFDLVFVLGFTQCTTLMVQQATWSGVANGVLVLAVLWWAWGAYAWLTSAVDPEEGPVRLVMFGAIAALLVIALAVPQAFGVHGLTFAVAYAAVRAAHLLLFAFAGRDDAAVRHSVATLAMSSGPAVTANPGFGSGAASTTRPIRSRPIEPRRAAPWAPCTARPPADPSVGWGT